MICERPLRQRRMSQPHRVGDLPAFLGTRRHTGVRYASAQIGPDQGACLAADAVPCFASAPGPLHCASVDGGVTRALNRTTADLSSYRVLVVIYLGMRINAPAGLRTLAPVWPGSRRSRLAVARCFRPVAAWACGKEANRRRASQKKRCISGKAMAGRIGLGSATHAPTSPTAIDQQRPHPMPDPDHLMSGQAGQQSRRAGALPLTDYVQFAQTRQNLNSGGDFDRAFLANGASQS